MIYSSDSVFSYPDRKPTPLAAVTAGFSFYISKCGDSLRGADGDSYIRDNGSWVVPCSLIEESEAQVRSGGSVGVWVPRADLVLQEDRVFIPTGVIVKAFRSQ